MRPRARLILVLILVIIIAGTFGFLYIKSNKENTKSSIVLEDHEEIVTPTISNVATPTNTPKITFTPTKTPPPSPTPTPTKSPIPDFVYMEVSKTKSIGKFRPTNLVYVDSSISTKKILVSKLIVSDLTKLINDAKKDGITLKAVSGYRSYEDQVSVFNGYVNNEMRNDQTLTKAEAEAKANVYSAYPGHSEHQLGTTVDVLSNESNYGFSVNENMKFVKWLEQNVSRYNFRISFEKGNPEYQYEPWHLRWMP